MSDLRKDVKKRYYETVLIVDFDDTLCIHAGDPSDIAGGTPNRVLIEKLNDLYDRGYRIEIHTARGHISTPNRAAADIKFRPIIMAWLEKHGVKYNRLTFNKPLAAVYIDDKAVRPDEVHLLDSLVGKWWYNSV